MLTIGDRFPDYKLKGVVSDDLKTAFQTFEPATHKGKWRVVFFYPKDFTFVCPTEIVGYAKLAREFADRDAVVLGASTDSEFVHLAWRKHEADLKGLAIPLLADTSKKLSTELGILMGDDRVSMRATFIVDPTGVIRHVTVNDGKVGRNPEEALRVLDALQSDELCPCNWKKGEATIKV
ncbi:MAG: Alkyl hydroperoxide reductase C [Planctomycetes bacterium]|nr:Alkyl hydroperoxide reductase C [Planctomycetota bacterium]